MCFYDTSCVSLDYEVLICVIMIFIGSMLSFVKFKGQTSKNMQHIRKLVIETCMCVS